MKSQSARAYPFLTKRQIVARIDADAGFARECALVLDARTQQRSAGAAPGGKAWGFMSSERVVATRLVARLRAGFLTEGEEQRLTALVRRYSKQLADHHRSLAIAENPALSAAAEKFGVLPGGSTPSDISQSLQESKEIPSRCHPENDRQPDDLEGDLNAEAEPVQEDELPRRVMEFVQRTPGQRTDAIAKALDTTTAMVAPTLRMLVQSRRLKKQGFGRGTRYFVR